MAVLDNASRIWAHFMRQVIIGPIGLTKAEIRAAVDATDQWIDDNQASYNAALPAAAQSGLTLIQKTLIFCYVAMRRAGILTAEGD